MAPAYSASGIAISVQALRGRTNYAQISSTNAEGALGAGEAQMSLTNLRGQVGGLVALGRLVGMAWAWWKIGGDELYRFRKRQGQYQIAGLLMPALRPLHMSAHTHLSDMWSDADGCVKSVSKRTCTVHNSPSLQGRRRERFPPCKRQGDAGECSVSVSLPFQSSNLAAAAAGLELLNGRDAERPAGGYVAVDFTIQPSLDMLF